MIKKEMLNISVKGKKLICILSILLFSIVQVYGQPGDPGDPPGGGDPPVGGEVDPVNLPLDGETAIFILILIGLFLIIEQKFHLIGKLMKSLFKI